MRETYVRAKSRTLDFLIKCIRPIRSFLSVNMHGLTSNAPPGGKLQLFFEPLDKEFRRTNVG